jgi:outer membrane protein TolC
LSVHSALVSAALLLLLNCAAGCQTGKQTDFPQVKSADELPFSVISRDSTFESDESNLSLAEQSDLPQSEESDSVVKASAAETVDGVSTRRTVKFAGFQNVAPPVPDVEPEVSLEDEPDSESEAAPDQESDSSDVETEDVDQEPAPEVPAQAASETGEGIVTLGNVLSSVRQCYPEIDVAIGELETANGKVLASYGEFDQVFSAHSISQPLGFYQTYRNGVGLSRPLYQGGEVYGTYRIGDGNFEPWYGERETNEGGEFKAGFSLPLLKDRNIDARRAKLFTSGYQRDQLNSNVEARMLLFQRIATQAYWDWVASGQAVQIQRRLLDLANQRVEQINIRVEEEDLAKIAQIDNDRLIAKRKNDLIKARRQVEKAAIKLSMFWRDGGCNPIIPSNEELPESFPDPVSISNNQLISDISVALAIRPELEELAAARNEARTDLRYAKNLMLPKLDVKGFAGQDVGGETSSTGDKTPFELQLGVLAEVPLQRREGIGKCRAALGKLKQIEAKIGFVSDKIQTEIQDAASALNAAADQIAQSRENLRLTRQSLELGRISFEEGDIDLLLLNIYESAVADAELQLLDAQFKHFYYRAVYEIAIRGRFDQ